jgi:hypothetical protein
MRKANTTVKSYAMTSFIGLIAMLTLSSAYGQSSTVGAGLTAKWWQWSISMPLTGHPFADPTLDTTAHDCTYNQSGNVWFLGGVFNASGTITRNCTVPAGVSLLVPALNTECSNVEPDPFYGEKPADRRACARSSAMTDFYVKLNGVEFTPQYVTSPNFHFVAPDTNPPTSDNVLFVPGPVSGEGVSAGYWTLIPPLAPGDYVLEFGGTFPDAPYTLAITYNLTVSP